MPKGFKHSRSISSLSFYDYWVDGAKTNSTRVRVERFCGKCTFRFQAAVDSHFLKVTFEVAAEIEFSYFRWFNHRFSIIWRIFNPNLITLIGTCTEKTHYGHDLGRVRTALKSSRRSFRAQYSCEWGRSVGSREETRRYIDVRRML